MIKIEGDRIRIKIPIDGQTIDGKPLKDFLVNKDADFIELVNVANVVYIPSWFTYHLLNTTTTWC